MKQIIILIIGILFISCNQIKKEKTIIKIDKKESESTEQIENFDWLLGKWKRLNEEEGKATFENWEKINETEYSGIGFTMQNGDTIKQENIRLIKVSNKWDIIVKVPEEIESVTFNGLGHSENEFICENKEIDFPNRIKYWKNGNKLNASVSSPDIEIQFEFEKINE
ncbi:hypothetical protein [Winogradskyella alexanderae]|uniref:Uncharacterized protein n=1 Tax=Winogradskyella alexanderae TaxID=2877123 RepID=A0ABS7XV65_9FLAO|nr:hypothetical protein [Winogradskyella alexanderae]MCA0133917.1 hypothetical protein [Winogradskyella alexanderae]